MITVKCKLNDRKLYPLVDKIMTETGKMEKKGPGLYEGNKNVINTSYFAIKEFLKNEELVNNTQTFTRVVDGEKEDVMRFYESLKNRGKTL